MWQQERFTINQTNAAPLQWQIPFSAAEVTRLSAPPQVTMLTPGKDAGSPAPASPGQKGNVGGAGYYRVQYDDETFATLAKAAPAFPDADRLNFLNDSWAMVQANRSRPAAHLDLLSTVASTEQSTAVWDALLGMIGYMDHLQQGAPGRPAFRSWAIRLLRPQLERLGWEPKPGESELIPPLRTDVIARLARYGDEDVRTEAASRFARYLADPASLKGDLRGTIIGLAGRFADLATFEELLARAQRETSTELRRELLGAVGAAQDPALAQRALQLSLGDTLRPREATRMVSRIGDSAEHPALAWDFAQKNLPALLAKLSAMEADDYVPGLLRPFQTEQRAAELEQFAKTNLPPSATAAVARATDDIRFKAEFRARLLPALDAWLARQP